MEHPTLLHPQADARNSVNCQKETLKTNILLRLLLKVLVQKRVYGEVDFLTGTSRIHWV
jgi:hypothetical protein